MYKIAHDMLPESTCNQFVFSNSNYVLRHSYFKIKLPPVKTNFKKRSLQYSGAKRWNELPNDVKALSFYSFKLDSRVR